MPSYFIQAKIAILLSSSTLQFSYIHRRKKKCDDFAQNLLVFENIDSWYSLHGSCFFFRLFKRLITWCFVKVFQLMLRFSKFLHVLLTLALFYQCKALIMGMESIKAEKNKHRLWLQQFRVVYLKMAKEYKLKWDTRGARICVQQYQLNEFNILLQDNIPFGLQPSKCNTKPSLWLHSSNIQQHVARRRSEKERVWEGGIHQTII